MAEVVRHQVTGAIDARAVLRVQASSAREEARAARAYVALTLAPVVGMPIEVGVFASRHVGQLAGRDLLALAPPLFVGLAVWLDRGAPRPRTTVAAAFLAVFLLLVALPLGRLVHDAALPDAFMLVPLEAARETFPGMQLDLVLLPAATLVLTLVVTVPRRSLWVIPAALALLFGAVSIQVSRVVVRESARIRTEQLGDDPRWIDRAVRGPVSILYAGELHWTAPYELAFWNRRVRSVYDLPGAQLPGPVPQTSVRVALDGSLSDDRGRPLRTDRVVAGAAVGVVGTPLSALARMSGQFVLWRVQPPLRLSAWLTGVAIHSFGPKPRAIAVTGGISSQARLAVYSCAGAQLLLALRVPERTSIEVRLNGAVARRFVARPGRVVSASVPLAPARGAAGQCAVELRASGFVEASRFEIAPP